MLMLRFRPATILLAIGLIVLVGACGSTRVISNDRTLFIALTDYHLTPQSVRTSSGPMTILVHNYGRLTHNLVVSIDGASSGSTRPIAPGQTAEMTVTLVPGTYLMASTILSDQATGQYGTLKVSS
jgi:hypothetical protein